MINNKDIIRSFNRAANSYDQYASLQQKVADNLLQRLQWVNINPRTIVDLGAGTGYCIKDLLQRYPTAQITALDISENMLELCRERYAQQHQCQYVCADMADMPFNQNSLDLIISSLAVHWQNDLSQCFAQIEKVLAPGGVFIFATLGVDTLKELRSSWQQVDDNIHVHAFFDMHDVGDALMQAQLSDPVMDMEYITLMHGSVKQLARQLQGLGVHNTDHQRTRGLTSRLRWERLQQAYEQFREPQGLPATYEVIYGIAWKPTEPRRKTNAIGEIRLDQIKRYDEVARINKND